MTKILLHEVGLRDGLQAESKIVETSQKIKWIDALSQTGIDIIQLGSFVNPLKMPQMADTDELFRHYSKQGKPNDHVIFSGLVLNPKGLDRALDCGAEMICMGVSASETHSLKNTGMSTAEALQTICAMARKSLSEGKITQASIQSAFGCGFEGKIDENKVLEIVKTYLDKGIRKISLADTAGMANPLQVRRLFTAIFELDKDLELTCHFHNTYGSGMANCYAAIQCGVSSYELAFGGLGGCPFTKVAAGNVATEDFVYMLSKMGERTDVDIEAIITQARNLSEYFGRELPGFVYKIKDNK